jgi:23S rRNA (uracil1939-C5)-methyltransferase
MTDIAKQLNTIDVTIDRIVGDGKGIGFANGKTVFISRTAPGDVVRARITRQQGTTIHGVIEEILSPSPMRIEPGHPHADNCAGCDLMHISYEDQLATKVNIIQDSLRRIAKLETIPEITIRPSEQQWNYRSRAEWQVDVPNKAVGYFAEGSRQIVDMAVDPVSTEGINTLLTTLRDDVEAGLVPPAAKEYRAVSTETGYALEPTATQRSAILQRTIGGEVYHFSGECFFQANVPVAGELLADVMKVADVARQDPGIAIDLYCGVGFFTLPLSRRYKRVIGIESFKPAVKFAIDNLAAAELTKTKILESPVEHWVAQNQSRHGRVSLVVFDPPRNGAGPKTIAGILRLNPAHIAAVSCDPATFSRDLRGLLDGGYELVNITAYDMFPQTHHVELMAHLRRRAI